MKKFSLLLFICLLFYNLYGFGQINNYPRITKDFLYSKIQNDTTNKYFVIFIFTSYCAGTNDIPIQAAQLDSITNHQCSFFLCQSIASSENDMHNPIDDIVKSKNLDPNNVYIIDPSIYKPNKKDGRAQGLLFRNDICANCQYLEIGVPLHIILDKNKNVLYYGYGFHINELDAILNCK